MSNERLRRVLQGRLKTERTSQKLELRPRCDAGLGKLYKMGNQGKVQRVIRELVATLVEELGPDEAARRLDLAANQLRGGNGRPKKATTREDRAAKPQPRIAVSS